MISDCLVYFVISTEYALECPHMSVMGIEELQQVHSQKIPSLKNAFQITNKHIINDINANQKFLTYSKYLFDIKSVVV